MFRCKSDKLMPCRSSAGTRRGTPQRRHGPVSGHRRRIEIYLDQFHHDRNTQCKGCFAVWQRLRDDASARTMPFVWATVAVVGRIYSTASCARGATRENTRDERCPTCPTCGGRDSVTGLGVDAEPMDPDLETRLANRQRASRCGAKTRAGRSCQCCACFTSLTNFFPCDSHGRMTLKAPEILPEPGRNTPPLRPRHAPGRRASRSRDKVGHPSRSSRAPPLVSNQPRTKATAWVA